MKDKSLTRVSVFLTSQIISLFGSAIVSYSIVWYITLKTSSTMALAISIVCTYMPQIVISMFSGTWGDKFNKKNLIIIGDTITGISTLILAILFINGFDSLYLLYGACALRSVGSGIQTPLEHAFLPLICPEEKLTKIIIPLITGLIFKINKNKWNLCYCFISNQYFISCYGRCFIKCNGFWTYPLY